MGILSYVEGYNKPKLQNALTQAKRHLQKVGSMQALCFDLEYLDLYAVHNAMPSSLRISVTNQRTYVDLISTGLSTLSDRTQKLAHRTKQYELIVVDNSFHSAMVFSILFQHHCSTGRSTQKEYPY